MKLAEITSVKIKFKRRFSVVSHRARLNVAYELARRLAWLLQAERRGRGARVSARADIFDSPCCGCGSFTTVPRQRSWDEIIGFRGPRQTQPIRGPDAGRNQ